jgi:hypothetical protein
VNAFNRAEYGEVSNLEDRQHQLCSDEMRSTTARRGVAPHRTAPRTMPDVEIDSRLAKKISSVRRDYCRQGKLEDSTAADGASRLAANAHCTTLHMSSSLPATCMLRARERRQGSVQLASGRLRLHRREIPLGDLVCIIAQAGIEIFPAVHLHDRVDGVAGLAQPPSSPAEDVARA